MRREACNPLGDDTMVSIQRCFIIQIPQALTVLFFVSMCAFASASNATTDAFERLGVTPEVSASVDFKAEAVEAITATAPAMKPPQTGLPPRHPVLLKRSPESHNLAMFHNVPVPEFRPASYDQVVELTTIFLFLYAYATYISFDDCEFFVQKSPDKIIINNLDILNSLLRGRGDIATNTPRLIGMAYEAIQIFNLVGCLFLESDLLESLPTITDALTEAFESSRNTRHHITLAEEWVLKLIDTLYFNRPIEPQANQYLTHQTLAITLNLNQKFLQQLQEICRFFPQLIQDHSLIRQYDAFIRTPAGRRTRKEIATSGIIHPLENYHGNLSMQATLKTIFMYRLANNASRYSHLNAGWVHEIALTIMRLTNTPTVTQSACYQTIVEKIQTKYPRTKITTV